MQQLASRARITARLAAVVIAAAALLASVAMPANAIVGPSHLTGRSDGRPLDGGDYPWMVAFIEPPDGVRTVGERTYCSGVLIKPMWVLSAAHCQHSVGDIVTIGRGSLASTQGERREVGWRMEAGVRVPFVHTLISNLTYCPTSLDNRASLCDVALVRLDEPATHPDLDLADADELSQWGEGTAARAYGYGRTVARSSVRRRMASDVPTCGSMTSGRITTRCSRPTRTETRQFATPTAAVH